MGPGMFDGMIGAILGIGVAIGLAVAGLMWLGYWLWSHISFGWLA